VNKRVLKKHLLASVGLISLTVAGAASAGTTLPPPPAAIWSWSGFYVGGHAGYGWGRDPFNDIIFSGKAPLLGINSNGAVGGFQSKLAGRRLGWRAGNRPLGHGH
jgi:outer membrane immunogenic protein